MRLFLELLNVCKSCTGSGMRNESEVPSRETAGGIGCFLFGMKRNAAIAVEYTQRAGWGPACSAVSFERFYYFLSLYSCA